MADALDTRNKDHTDRDTFVGHRIRVMTCTTWHDDMADYKDAVVQAAKNALTAAKNKLEEGEKIVQIMQITVYVNSEPDFTKQPKIADFASEYFCEELGESGVGSRAAVGVAVLPGEAPVEIAIIAGVGK